jgi:ABC-type branched-subunit amino acid transport system permease subunit
LAVLVPFIVDTKLPVWNTALASLLMFLSLGLLVNTSGQISLCHFGFLAIGATTFAHMQARGLPWPVAVLIAGLTVVPVGAIISIPAIRLSGLYLALATLGFGVVLAQFFYPKGIMFGSSSSLVTSRPSWFQSDREYYFLLLAIGLVGIAAVIVIQRSRLGRLLRGIADSPTALSSLGTNTNISRVLVFCISAFMAGVSGSLIAGLFGAVGREQFQFLQSLVALSVLMVLGQRTIPAAILGCLALYVPQAYLHGNADVAQWTQLVFGLLAIGIAVLAGGRVSAALARSAAKNHGRLRGPAGERRDLARPEPAYASVGRS